MTARLLDLPSSILALERGNWPVLAAGAAVQRRAQRTDEAARLGFIHSEIAESMHCQARGSVVAADARLAAAARALPAAYRYSVRGHCFAVLPAHPPNDQIIPLLIWRTARVIFREQRGLDEHRGRLRPGRLSALEILVVAYVEYLRWVDCDYFLTAPGVDVRDIPYEAQSGLLRDRATDLCRLAEPASPAVTEWPWRRSGGKPRLCVEALVLLAAGTLVPERGPGALPLDVPVRCGRIEAYRRACQRRDDLGYDPLG